MHYYDIDQPTPLSVWMHDQRRRVQRTLRGPQTDETGQWVLTIRGHKPAQVALEQEPHTSRKVDNL